MQSPGHHSVWLSDVRALLFSDDRTQHDFDAQFAARFEKLRIRPRSIDTFCDARSPRVPCAIVVRVPKQIYQSGTAGPSRDRRRKPRQIITMLALDTTPSQSGTVSNLAARKWYTASPEVADQTAAHSPSRHQATSKKHKAPQPGSARGLEIEGGNESVSQSASQSASQPSHEQQPSRRRTSAWAILPIFTNLAGQVLQPIARHLAIQPAAFDTQHRRGAILIPTRHPQGALNQRSLHLL